jgi:hypothetical protein
MQLTLISRISSNSVLGHLELSPRAMVIERSRNESRGQSSHPKMAKPIPIATNSEKITFNPYPSTLNLTLEFEFLKLILNRHFVPHIEITKQS